MRPRNVLITNAAWLGTGHMSDVSVLKPIFHRDRLVAFSATTSHMPDIGGGLPPPEARQGFQERVHLPPAELLPPARAGDPPGAPGGAHRRPPGPTKGGNWAPGSA